MAKRPDSQNQRPTTRQRGKSLPKSQSLHCERIFSKRNFDDPNNEGEARLFFQELCNAIQKIDKDGQKSSLIEKYHENEIRIFRACKVCFDKLRQTGAKDGYPDSIVQIIECSLTRIIIMIKDESMGKRMKMDEISFQSVFLNALQSLLEVCNSPYAEMAVWKYIIQRVYPNLLLYLKTVRHKCKGMKLCKCLHEHGTSIGENIETTTLAAGAGEFHAQQQCSDITLVLLDKIARPLASNEASAYKTNHVEIIEKFFLAKRPMSGLLSYYILIELAKNRPELVKRKLSVYKENAKEWELPENEINKLDDLNM